MNVRRCGSFLCLALAVSAAPKAHPGTEKRHGETADSGRFAAFIRKNSTH